MPLAVFKDLCVDANEPSRLGPFWAAALGLEWRTNPPGIGHLVGPTPQHRVWFAEVPEAKTVKQRVHLDIYAWSLADLESLGATVVEAHSDDWRWTIMADPEGGEFCAFLRDELPVDRLHGVVVDSADPAAQAEWWGAAYGAEIVHHDDGYSTVQSVPGMPILTMDFVPVPEPKTVKNRVHWDVIGDADALAATGATVLRRPEGSVERRPEGDIVWWVLADPEGNEFCVFLPDS